MEIATNKVEYVSINCPRKPAPLQIRDLSWSTHSVPCVPGKENVRYLGISLPVGGDDLPTLRWARDLLMTSLKHLELRAAPISCKIYVATAQVFPAVMYRATKASWTLSQYRSLDKIFSSFYRRIFRLERSFPEALLYASTKYAALGLRRFSDEAQKLKWHSMQRLLAAEEDTKGAAEAILERAFHAHSRPAASTGPTLLTSLFQWGSANGLYLSKKKPHNGADATLARISEALHSGVPSRVDSIFTDGSVKLGGLEVSDSLVRKESLSAKASGAFSVVVVYASDHDGSKHSKAVRIPVSTDKVTIVTPYLMELLGQLVVASVCDLSHPDTKVYCDCSSVVTNVNNTITGGIKSLSASSHKFLLGSLPPSGHNVEWTRSHPERRLALEDIAQWSDKDKGIYAADAAAGAEFDELNRSGLPVCTFLELALSELVDALIPEGSWHWREDNSSGRILTTRINNHCQHVLLDNYCVMRDRYRSKRNQAPKWGAVVPILVRTSLTYWGRKKQCLRAWDKSFTNGYNRAKSNHVDPKCSQCGQEDSVFHMCLRCPHRELRDIREKAFDDQVSALKVILKDAPQWKRSMFNSLTDLCWARIVQSPDDTEHLWRGLLPGVVSLYIPPDVLETPLDSEEQLRQLRRDIKNFLQPLADATQDMLSARGRLYHSAPPPSTGTFHRGGCSSASAP